MLTKLNAYKRLINCPQFGIWDAKSQSSHVYQRIFSRNIELLRKEKDFLKRWRACSDEKIQECYRLSLLLLFFRAGSHETQSRNAAPFSGSDQVQEVTGE